MSNSYVEEKVNDVFKKIIEKLPRDENRTICCIDRSPMQYVQFYEEIRECFQNINNKETISPIGLIQWIPQTISNLYSIRESIKIIRKEKEIKKKYFIENGEYNIRKRIEDIRCNLEPIAREGDSEDLEVVDRVLTNFEIWMESNILKDLIELSMMVRRRKK